MVREYFHLGRENQNGKIGSWYEDLARGEQLENVSSSALR